MNRLLFAFALAGLGASGFATADYAITQGPTAPVYTGHQIGFDDAGAGPMDPNFYASDGITIMSGLGDGGVVDDWDAIFGPFGLGDGLSHNGGFGTFLTFDGDISEMSFDVWNNGTDPIFGGIGIFVFDDGVEVASFFTTPSWAGIGDASFNITTTGGDAFDEVRIVDFDFSSLGIFSDNYSWNEVPAPSALALLAVAAGFGARRRRHS